MNIRFMRRNFIFVLFTFVLMIFSCSAADAAYDGSTEGPNSYISDDECLTFTADQDGSTVSFKWYSGSNVQYNKNGSGWEDYTANTPISLNEGEFVRFKGSNVITNYNYSDHFSMTGSISASGFVDSLRLDSNGQFQGLDNYCYQNMFFKCTSLTSAPELPATNLAEGCYWHMFTDCTSLTNAPELPATTLVNTCYNSMFWGCKSLTSAPELPATTLNDCDYSSMFDGCSSLDLSTTPGGDNVYQWTFKRGVTGMLPNGILDSAQVDENGYVTLYSKYPLSASLRTVLTKEGTTLISDTDKASVKDGKLLSATISGKIGNIDRAISSASGKKAFITLVKDGNNVASSKKFAVTVSDGKIKAENIDLYTDNPSGAAPDDATENNITPGLYDSYMTFVA